MSKKMKPIKEYRKIEYGEELPLEIDHLINHELERSTKIILKEIENDLLKYAQGEN